MLSHTIFVLPKRKKIRHHVLITFSMASSVLLSACFETNGVDDVLADQVSGRSNVSLQSNPPVLPEIETTKSQKYTPTDRDPMKNKQYVNHGDDRDNTAMIDGQSSALDPNRPEGYQPEPLERFNISSIKLLGTMRKQGSALALLQDPEGTTHTVQIGHYVGNRFGRVSKIQESFIEVEEKEFSLASEEKTIRAIINLETKPL